MSLTDDIAKLESWWHDFIGHLFKHPQAETVAPKVIAAVADAIPQATQHPNVTDLLFARPTVVVPASASGPPEGTPTGPVLDDFGAWKRNAYEAHTPFVYTVTVPAKNFPPAAHGVEFVWGAAESGEVAARVSASVEGTTHFAEGSQESGSLQIPGAKPGDTYRVSVVYSVGQPGHAQIQAY